ncbi:MAG: hypothetical protein AAF585_09230 [Verrucomicrobiota bacterium]
MSALEIQRQIPALTNEELNQISAALVSERRKRSGIDLDELADQRDREGTRVDWDEVKEDVLNAP